MKITPFSPDASGEAADKYADECSLCAGAGVIALNSSDGYETVLCSCCEGSGITVDWTVAEPALLGERR